MESKLNLPIPKRVNYLVIRFIDLPQWLRPGLFTATALILGVMNAALGAEVSSDRPLMHPLFSDHLVLQRGAKAPIWGWTQPGAEVAVRFAGQTKTSKAGTDGKWIVRLAPMPASAEPRILMVSTSAGDQQVTIRDVLVGDVWLCSGQSNMEMGIGACNVPEEIAQANYPQVRLLTVPKTIAYAPRGTLECQWQKCSPTTVAAGGWGGFTAVGYFFGRELHQNLKIPVGLIHSSWGGTVIEAWTSAESLRPLGDFNEHLDQVACANQLKPRDFDTDYEKWCQRNDPGTAQGWAKREVKGADWKKVTMPQYWERAGLPEFDGILWFRRVFEVPAEWAGKDLNLSLGPIDDIDTTFVNGVKVGQANRYDITRVYKVPASGIKVGANTVYVRVLDTGGDGGFWGRPDQMFVAPDGTDSQVSLAGSWQMRDSAPRANLPAPPAILDEYHPNVASVLYNGMIAPLLPFAIKGAIWYGREQRRPR